MFIGHFAVGFAGKKAAPRASLQALLFAALFADVLWPVLVAVGAERVRIVPGATAYNPMVFDHYPWSHSLLMLVIWGGLIGAFFRNRPDGKRTWLVIALLVVSHWVLDWITHAPDMPVGITGPKVGLGLWNSVPGTMAVELAMFVAGVGIYMSVTRARDRIGSIALWALVLLLVGFYVFDSLSAVPPPSVAAIWVSGLIATAVILVWAGWIDRHRSSSS